MGEVLTGVIVGGLLIVLNLIVSTAQASRRRKKQSMDKSSETDDRICDMEQAQRETHELVKLSLRMNIILGDGMVQSGVNGAVKKAFEAMKQEVVTKL